MSPFSPQSFSLQSLIAVVTLRAELQQAHAAKQAELKAAHEEATRNLTEVITELEKRERGQLAAEEHARQLETELEHARAVSHGPSPQDQARIAELERLLDARMLDVEEADEKLIEVSPVSCGVCTGFIDSLFGLYRLSRCRRSRRPWWNA